MTTALSSSEPGKVQMTCLSLEKQKTLVPKASSRKTEPKKTLPLGQKKTASPSMEPWFQEAMTSQQSMLRSMPVPSGTLLLSESSPWYFPFLKSTIKFRLVFKPCFFNPFDIITPTIVIIKAGRLKFPCVKVRRTGLFGFPGKAGKISMEYPNKEQYQTIISGRQSLPMPKQNPTETQAIMDLLYIGDDESDAPFNEPPPKKEPLILAQRRGQPKSSTMHLKNTQKTLNILKHPHQSLAQSRGSRKRSSQNKENLKNILKKLESSPSPPAKRLCLFGEREPGRVQTQASEPGSKSRSKYVGNKSLQLTKKSINTFFDRKKDKDLIKSLIKAKIVEKLKRVEGRRSEKKVYNFGLKTEPLRGLNGTVTHQPRTSVQRTQKAKSKSNFLNLLWEEKKMNNPVLNRRSSKISLRQLLL